MAVVSRERETSAATSDDDQASYSVPVVIWSRSELALRDVCPVGGTHRIGFREARFKK